MSIFPLNSAFSSPPSFLALRGYVLSNRISVWQDSSERFWCLQCKYLHLSWARFPFYLAKAAADVLCTSSLQPCPTGLWSLLLVEKLQDNKLRCFFLQQITLSGKETALTWGFASKKNYQIIHARFCFTSQCPAVEMIFSVCLIWILDLSSLAGLSGSCTWRCSGNPSPCSEL